VTLADRDRARLSALRRGAAGRCLARARGQRYWLTRAFLHGLDPKQTLPGVGLIWVKNVQ